MDREQLNNYRYLANKAVAYKYLENEDYENGLSLLDKLVEENKNEEDVKVFINSSLTYAKRFSKEKNWLKILDIYRKLVGLDGVPIKLYKNMGLCLSAIGQHALAIKYFKIYENLDPSDSEVYIFIGELALNEIKNYKLALEYYKKALDAGVHTFTLYNSLGHICSKIYRDSHKEEQIDYFEKALELEPNNRIVVNNLAYVYGKFGETKKADEMYGKLLMMNPTHSEIHSYGAYLVKNKKFKAGFKFLRHRFQKEDISGTAFGNIVQHMDKVWKIGEPLENKKVLIHYEQGFGDSIMFARFIKDIEDKCKSIELVLQPGLIDLFKDSGFTLPIKKLSEVNIDDYDVIVPMMDLPLVCNLKADNIPYAQGYLDVPLEKVKAYKKKFIKRNKKFKIGFAFEGSEASLETKRDIPLELFYPLMKMKKVDLYCFQVGDIFGQFKKVPSDYKFTKLADSFRNWEDTALAMKNMDLIITSDNGVMNLAGALGIKTFGVFNSMTEWRWIKTQGDDIAWYSSVKPFQCPSTDDWASAMGKVIEEVEELVKNKEK